MFFQPVIIFQPFITISGLHYFPGPLLFSQAFIIHPVLHYSPRLSLPNHRALHSAPAFHYITPLPPTPTPTPTPTLRLPTQPLPGKVVHSIRDYYRAIIFLFIFLSPFFIAGCVFYRYLSIHCVDHFLWSWYQFTRSC